MDNGGTLTLKQLVYHLCAQQFCRAVFHFAKLWTDLRLKRKASQNACTERMDSLDFQAARCFDRARKECPCIAQLVGVDLAFDPHIIKRLAQIGIGHHRPVAQALEQAVLHLGRSSLGICQTQDVLRRDPFQQKPRDAIRQHPRLTRACIGRQPCRNTRIGSIYLPLCGLIADHLSISGSGSWLVSHSPKRDR